MKINDPKVVAEVSAAFQRYQDAIIGNDVAVLNELFWDNALTLRYGIGENLYGHKEIAGYRSARNPAGLARVETKRVVTTYGQGYATTNIEFTRQGRLGRQSQAWARRLAHRRRARQLYGWRRLSHCWGKGGYGGKP